MTIRNLRNAALFIALLSSWVYYMAWSDAKTFDGDKRHFASLSSEVKFAIQAQKSCDGERADYDELPDGNIRCRVKRVNKTVIAKADK